jgi:hypothetical protein
LPARFRTPFAASNRGRIDLAQMARCKLVVAILLVLVVTDVVRQAVPRCIIEPTWHCGCISQVAFTVGVSNEKWFDDCERQAESTRGRAIIQADCGS